MLSLGEACWENFIILCTLEQTQAKAKGEREREREREREGGRKRGGSCLLKWQPVHLREVKCGQEERESYAGNRSRPHIGRYKEAKQRRINKRWWSIGAMCICSI